MLWWWGLFSSASVQVTERGNYRYVYLDAQGPYSKLPSKQKEVLFELGKQNISAGVQITVVLSDPRTTPYEKLNARTGFIIDASAEPKAPLLVDVIPVRKVALAEIKAHPLLAYGKTYSALLAFSQANHMSLQLPTVELFDKSILSVEMPLNINNLTKVAP